MPANTIAIKCRGCGTMFESTQIWRMYCGRECADEALRPPDISEEEIRRRAAVIKAIKIKRGEQFRITAEMLDWVK
jgi:hypothetical protein